MSWFKITNAADKARIDILDFVGEGGVTAAKFIAQLDRITATSIDLHINSGGGEVFDGLTIFNAIRQHPSTVNTYIDGLAASIASIVAIAGDTVNIAKNAFVMIHNPAALIVGTAADFRQGAATLETMANTLAQTYAARGGASVAKFKELMAAETWLDADQALKLKLADRITPATKSAPSRIAACLQRYKNVPRQLAAKAPAPTADDETPLVKFQRAVDRHVRAGMDRRKATLKVGREMSSLCEQMNNAEKARRFSWAVNS